MSASGRADDRPRFRSGFDFARLGVQALLGLAFDHLCPRLLEGVHAYLSQYDLGLAVPSCWVNNRDDYICGMCGRIIQSSGPLRYAIVDGMNVRDNRVHNYPPRWNGTPSQGLLVIRRNHQMRNVSLDPLALGPHPPLVQ